MKALLENCFSFKIYVNLLVSTPNIGVNFFKLYSRYVSIHSDFGVINIECREPKENFCQALRT